MGTLRRGDGQVVFAQEGVGEVRRVESGDMTAEFGRADQALDPTPLFRGLPDDMCQCRHQGYVVSGQLTFKTKDGLLDVAAGEAFDVPPDTFPWHRRVANGCSSRQRQISGRPMRLSSATSLPQRAPATGPPSRPDRRVDLVGSHFTLLATRGR
jgi:hypothetical protein